MVGSVKRAACNRSGIRAFTAEIQAGMEDVDRWARNPIRYLVVSAGDVADLEVK